MSGLALDTEADLLSLGLITPRAEAVVVPCEARDLYLAYPGDSEEETCPEDPGTRRVASCREGEDLVNQMEEGRVTA